MIVLGKIEFLALTSSRSQTKFQAEALGGALWNRGRRTLMNWLKR